MSKRNELILRTAAFGAIAVTLGVGVARARELVERYRLRRMSNATSMASPPFTPADDDPDCSLFPGVPEIVGSSFDPGRFDQIDLAGNGKFVAFASAVTPSSPGVRTIVVLKEGDVPEYVAEATGDDDQPSIGFDQLGWRMAFRGSDGAAGQTGSNVYLHTFTRAVRATPSTDGTTPPPTSESDTRNLTGLDTAGGLFARDPSLAPRTFVREIRSGVTVRERDARVAFVSNGDLDKGRLGPNAEVDGKNVDQREQVFLWRERERRFEQLTRNTDDTATMARPSIAGNGRFVAFESDADLVPDAANPRDPSEVGNPDGVRQIYLWVETRSGGVLRQITWGDEDCLAPRISPDARFVFFCSRGDLLPGGNPEGNFEIFRWRRAASPAARLAQLTQTTSGDSVLPRPTRSPRRFVFYSTAAPPIGDLEFGAGIAQCGPKAMLWAGGRVRLVAGTLDAVNAGFIADGKNPVLTGPPAATRVTKVHFATNDPALDPPGTTGLASLIQYHLARATRYARR